MKLYTHKITVTYNIEGTLTDFDFIGQDESKAKAEAKAHEKWHRFAILYYEMIGLCSLFRIYHFLIIIGIS